METVTFQFNAKWKNWAVSRIEENFILGIDICTMIKIVDVKGNVGYQDDKGQRRMS